MIFVRDWSFIAGHRLLLLTFSTLFKVIVVNIPGALIALHGESFIHGDFKSGNRFFLAQNSEVAYLADPIASQPTVTGQTIVYISEKSRESRSSSAFIIYEPYVPGDLSSSTFRINGKSNTNFVTFALHMSSKDPVRHCSHSEVTGVPLILRAIDNNCKLLDTIIRRINDFNGALAARDKEYLEIPMDLPTKKKQKGFGKKKKGNEFFDPDPQVTSVWNEFAKLLTCRNPGYLPHQNVIRTHLLENFIKVRDEYVRDAGEIRTRILNLEKELRSTESHHNSKSGLVGHTGKDLEAMKAKMDADAAAGRPADPKLAQSFADGKTVFNTEQVNTVAALIRLNEQRAQFSVDVEDLMLQFEKVDLKREDGLRSAIDHYSYKFDDYVRKRRAMVGEVSGILQKVLPTGDVDKVLVLSTKAVESPKIAYECPRMDAELAEYMTPRQMFEPEVDWPVSEITEETVSEDGELKLSPGNMVWTQEEGPTTARVANVMGSTGIIMKDKMRRLADAGTLCKVNGAHATSVITELSVNDGELVLVSVFTPEAPVTECMNVYRRKGKVPTRLLVPLTV